MPVTAEPAVLGYFFLDLHPRDGKYSHAAAFPFRASAATAGENVLVTILCCDDGRCCDGDGLLALILSAGGRVLPVCAMVCNFTKPTPTQPALLDHDETVTYFHEFGHVMHCICSKASLVDLQAFNVENVRRAA